MNGVEFRIALRYLFAHKSNNVVNWISAICVAGISIGTAALILILSVYNGFDRTVRENLGRTDSPYLLVCENSKYFESPVPAGRKVLSEKVMVCFGENRCIAKATGVEGCITPSVSEDLSRSLDYSPRSSGPLTLFLPSAKAHLSLLNPGASMRSISFHPEAIFQSSSDSVYPEILLSLEDMRRLTGIKTAVTAVQLSQRVLIPGYVCLDAQAQHPGVLRMLKMEKFALYLILLCIVIILTFNIFSALSLLKIEKAPDCFTLLSLGLPACGVRRIFFFEGILITVLSLFIGICAGLGLCFLQDRSGLVVMPGLGEPYPVCIQPLDIVLCALSVLLIGFICTCAAQRK